MKVLILGGTGAMGIHLVKLLSENGVETVVTSRTSRRSVGNVRYIQGNARDDDFLQIILQERWDAIVDFMTYTTLSFEKRIDFLLNATSQYVFLSSARVYAGSETPITETSSRLLDVSKDEEFLSTDEYSLAKARQENVLKQSGRSNWTIVRPYITYSEIRLQLGVLEKEEWLYRAMKGRTIVFSSDIISRLTTMTYGGDVARGISALIGNSSARGETFHITAKNVLTWNKVLTIYLDSLEQHLGRRPRVLLQNLNAFMKCKNVEYQIKYDRLFDRVFDNAKCSEHIDTSSFVRTERGLRSCLEHFLQNPQFRNINWYSEALKDRQTKERASLREISGIKQKLRYLHSRYLA